MDTALSPPVGLLLGGRYHVGSRIARGGMATVYLGTDTRLDRVVALKIAHPELSDDAEFVRRFIGEARSAARLNSPNVVAIFDQGSDKRLHYIAMEYVPGRTLRELLSERGRLGQREALDIMMGVLAGLDAAHQAGLAHRDVKPENVLITTTGTIKVADFGLARAVAGAVPTNGGMIIGTAAYLAPEQVAGGVSDARTDVYAAGIMLFEMLTGVQPHTAESPLAVAYKHVDEVVPAPSSFIPGISGALDALVAMSTSRDPDLRPSSAGQFMRAASEARDHLAQSATAPAAAPARPYLPADLGPDGYPLPGPDYHGPGPRVVLYNDSHPYDQPQGPGPGAGTLPGQQADGYGQPWDAMPSTRQDIWPEPRREPWPDPRPDPRPGAVGASALPSLGPQSSAAGPIPPAEPPAGMNHTLVVSDTSMFGEYGEGNGYGPPSSGSDFDGGRFRGSQPGVAAREPWLQRWLFSRRLFYLSAGLAVLVVIALLSWWLTSGQYRTVPSLHGITAAAAKSDLASLGLHTEVGASVHNQLPKGEVVRTSPSAGKKLASGSTVKLTVSLGPLLIQVPNVSGESLGQARAGLRSVHLTPGAVRQATSSSVPAGEVINTAPRAYSDCPMHQKVALVVSAGPGLPDFIGQQLQVAQAAAQQGGYTIQQVTDPKSSQPANTITAQSPPPNTPIKPGEVVIVHISPGPPGVPVPNVQGDSLQEAVQALHQAGFQVAVNHDGPGDRVGSYSPQGTQPKGSTITLNVGWFSGL